MFSSDIQSRFGTAVRAHRKHLGYSQEELAERAGLHRTYVADVERGARNLSLASIDKLAHALGISISALFGEATGSTPTRPHNGGVEILLIEGDPKDAETMLQALESARVTNRVQVTQDGREALELVSSTDRFGQLKPATRPHLILLDLGLPRTGGLEVLRRLKADKNTRNIPVVVLAKSERQPDVSESLRLGAETFIVKPVDFQRIAGVVPRLKLSWYLVQGTSASAD